MSVPTYSVSNIKRHSYVATFGNTVIAPLSAAPKIEPDLKVVDSRIYENGGEESVASILVKNAAKITLETKDIETAMSLIGAFAAGNDLMGSTNKKALTFTPTLSGEKTLIFPAAILQPELSYVPAMGQDHTAKLVFHAVEDSTTHKLFTFS